MGILEESVLASFDSKSDIAWNLNGVKEAVASFSVNQAKVVVTFAKTNSGWGVRFDVHPPGAVPLTLTLQVLGGVFQVIKEFLEVRQPDQLAFASKNEDLGRLYGTYLSKQDTQLHEMGYIMHPQRKVSSYAEFVIVKTRPSQWR